MSYSSGSIGRENYFLKIFQLTKDEWYLNRTKSIAEFVTDTFRVIEPSHFKGDVIVFHSKDKTKSVGNSPGTDYYDNSMLNHSFGNIVFSLSEEDDEKPKIWVNVNKSSVNDLLSTTDGFVAYKFLGAKQKEVFVVNDREVSVKNKYSCPSIFALQYGKLDEALRFYSQSKIRTANCEIFRKCFYNNKYIYFKSGPENCLQKSLREFLSTRIRGVDVVREYNLGASKPVDVRVHWREANRSALIELKWMGKSVKDDGSLNSGSHANSRGNDGMKQIKEYLDLGKQDSPTVINKGYLVVIDARRKVPTNSVVTSVNRKDGFKYAGKELSIKPELEYWKFFPDISTIFRMFVEPICTI